jgi:hypothetical protein
VEGGVCPKVWREALPQAILEYPASQTAETRRAISTAMRGIDLLRECRTRLIADVVTG